MAGTTTDITSILADLSDAGFQAFCDGITAMFDVDMRCERRQAGMETAGALPSRFKKLTAIHLVAADGVLNGTIPLLFDQGGLFVLSGVIVMLPESRIIEQVRRGSIQDAQNLQDATGEVGNLLVGSWDTLFREQCLGHKHFVKKASIIGKPSEKLGEMGVSANSQVLSVVYEMTVGPYPSFLCAAVFPTAVLASFHVPAMASVDEAVTQEPPAGEPTIAQVPRMPRAAETAMADRPVPPPESAAPVQPQSAGPAVVPEPLNVVAVTADSSAGWGDTRTGDAIVQSVTLGDGGADASVTVCPSPAAACPGVSRVLSGRQPSGTLAELLATRAADIMATDVVWASPEDTVQAVLAKMQEHDTGYVLIGRNGTLEGLVSNSTILGTVSLYLRPVFAKWRRPEDDATLGVKVKWIMSRPVRTVRPDTSLEAMIECLRRSGGRCLPVVDENGAVRGIITVFDILMCILASNNRDLSWQGRAPQSPALLL